MIGLPLILLGTPLLSGVFSTLIFGRPAARQTIPGLLFHSILGKPGREMSHFPAQRFAMMCNVLASEGFSTISLAALRDPNMKNVSARKNPVLLTFDDGLKCIYEEALPILLKHHQNATVFCVSGYTGKKSGWDVFPQNIHLSIDEIKKTAAAGIEIGSHTATHACLPYLNESSIKNELKDSKHLLEDITGKPVTSLSFPYGCWTRRIWEIAKATGYTAATIYRGNAEESEGLYTVQGVYQLDTIADIKARLSLTTLYSTTRARARMMSHFSRGTPVWKYRKEYTRI